VHVPDMHALAGSGLGSLFRLSRWKIFDALEVIFKPMSTTKSWLKVGALVAIEGGNIRTRGGHHKSRFIHINHISSVKRLFPSLFPTLNRKKSVKGY
jgi:hypothetical protein